jgi:glyoxylase-like metal-dependent hydrolase (beta-lactamase superfamily II)
MVPKQLGRGERVIAGLWRLRLPLPWPGIPHCNAWAIARGDGIVLVDCGMHEPGSLGQLQRALEQVGLSLEHVRLLACTHAHADHWGQAAPVIERAGCELWLHPNHAHATATMHDPDQALARRLEIGRQSGVPERALREYLRRSRERPSGIAAAISPDQPLLDGTVVSSDLGDWHVYETPGHCPSHVCLFQPERRILISGDHVLGRVSLYYDYGFSDDPVGEFLRSLEIVDGLDARLALCGHGRPFVDVHGHIDASRRLVAERLARARAIVSKRPRTALGVAHELYDEPLDETNAAWRLTETLCYLRHLEKNGVLTPERDGEAQRWRLA